MKKIILSILAVVLCAIALIVFMIIRSFNVDNYKEQIVNSLANLTGKKVEEIKIGGETTLSWKPAPTFVMNQLSIANQAEGSEPDMIKVDQVQVEMEWTSFFKSPLVIKRIILKKPEILVERKYTYQTNFAFPVLFQMNRQMNTDGMVKELDAASIRIDELKIEDGILRWKNLLTNNSFTVSDLNGTGSADSLDGPYTFTGHTIYQNQKILIEMKTGKMQVSAPLPVSLKLSDESQKNWVNLNADLNQDSKDKWFFGGGSFSLEKPKNLLKIFGVKDWYDTGKLSGSYKITVAPKKIIFQDVVFSQQNEEDTRFSCVFNFINDYNEKKAYLDVKNLSMKDGNGALWKNVLQSFNFGGMQNALEIKINAGNPAASDVFGNQFSLSATLIQNKLDGEVVASYPNDTAVSFKGTYDLGQKNLSGSASFGSSDMLGFLKNLSAGQGNYLPQDHFKNVHLEGQLTFSPDLYQYDITTGIVDDMTLSGKIGYLVSQKGWMTDLKIKDLNVDAYYTVPTGFLSTIYDFILGKTNSPLPAVLENSQIGLEVEKLKLLGTDFENFKIQTRFLPQEINVDAFVLSQSPDNNVSFSGKILQAASTDVSFNPMMLSWGVSDFELAQKLGVIFPKWLTENHKNFQGSVQYQGTRTQGEIQAQLQADNAELSVAGTIQNVFEKPQLNQTDFHLKYPNLSHLAHLIYPEKDLFQKMPVAVDFQAKVSTDTKEIQWENGILYLGDDRWNTAGSLELNPFKLKTDIKATRFNADLFLSEFASEENALQVSEDLLINVSLLADVFQYQGYQASNLKSQWVLENQTLSLKELSVSFPENPQSLFSLTGQGQLGSDRSFTGRVKMQDVPLSQQLLSMGDYVLGGGAFSTEFDFSAKGNTYEALRHSLNFQGPFTYKNATLQGVDVAAWQEAVEATLKMAEMTQGFKSRLEFAFKNGQTQLPQLSGQIQSRNGVVKFYQVVGQNQQVLLDGAAFDWVDIGNTMHLTLPFVLKSLQKSLPIVLDITGQSSTVKMYDFIQSFQDNVKIEAQRLAEIQKQAQKKEAEERRLYLQKNATDLFGQTDALVQSLQKKILLNPSAKANEKMNKINKMAQEVRKLAAKTNLTEAENTALLEKSKLLFAEAQDFENWLGAEDLMAQKETAMELPPQADKLMNKMEKIYQQNPRSVVMANLILNARQTKQDLQKQTDLLEKTKTETEVKNLLSQIQENFLKLHKASEYMEKLNESLSEGR